MSTCERRPLAPGSAFEVDHEVERIVHCRSQVKQSVVAADHRVVLPRSADEPLLLVHVERDAFVIVNRRGSP